MEHGVSYPAGDLNGASAVNLFWWTGVPNLGDYISPLIVSHFLGGRQVRLVDRDVRGKLLACGSIIHLAARDGDTVWGSGLMAPDLPLAKARDLHILAVRGPRTARRLAEEGHACPSVFGDPGLLLPAVFPGNGTTSVYGLGVIPHYVDKALIEIDDPDVRVLDVQADAGSFLQDLWRCKRVVSSALHGIILAEAYGIPADWVRLSSDLAGGSFKFLDYYEGTDRECPDPLRPDQIYKERAWARPQFDAERLARALSAP